MTLEEVWTSTTHALVEVLVEVPTSAGAQTYPSLRPVVAVNEQHDNGKVRVVLKVEELGQ